MPTLKVNKEGERIHQGAPVHFEHSKLYVHADVDLLRSKELVTVNANIVPTPIKVCSLYVLICRVPMSHVAWLKIWHFLLHEQMSEQGRNYWCACLRL